MLVEPVVPYIVLGRIQCDGEDRFLPLAPQLADSFESAMQTAEDTLISAQHTKIACRCELCIITDEPKRIYRSFSWSR